MTAGCSPTLFKTNPVLIDCLNRQRVWIPELPRAIIPPNPKPTCQNGGTRTARLFQRGKATAHLLMKHHISNGESGTWKKEEKKQAYDS